MRFEKASHESWIGWIAFSEVFLLATLMMLSMALVFDATATSSQKSAEQLKEDNTELAAQNQNLIDDLTKASEKQEDTDQQLEKSREDLTDSQKELDEARKEKQAIEASLVSALSLLKEKDNELALAETKSKKLQEQLTEAKTEFEELEKLNQQLAQENKDAKKVQEELAQLKVLLAGLPQKLKTTEAERDRLAKNQQALSQQVKDLLAQLGGNKDEIARLKIALEEMRTGAGRLRQELLGLKGEMNRVVFLFDRSGSMTNRWDYTRKIVENWLSYLPVQNCAVLTFSDSVRPFPADGSLMVMQGEEGQKNREELSEWLQNTKPAGLTNTLAAFESAYQYKDVSMIILFTDGAPRTGNTPNDAKLDTAMRDQIYQLCQKSKIPINTVGLGDFYTNEELGKFLMKLADDSNGAFLGR